MSERTVSTKTNCVVSSSLNYFTRKYSRRLPTRLELARFWKYARRMRKFKGVGSLVARLSLEAFLVFVAFQL